MSPWEGKTVLIVDDSESIRSQLVEAYQKLGLKVIGQCENGVEALSFIARSAPDLVSLDIIMPEMDGIECYRKIRVQYGDMSMLVVSCLAADPKVAESFENEIPPYVFVGKPVDIDSLRSHLELLANLGQSIMSEEAAALEEEAADASKIPDINQIA